MESNTIETPKADLAHVMESLSRLYQDLDLIEVRLLDAYPYAGAENKRRAAAGWYKTPANIGRDVAAMEAYCDGKWYACLNPVIAEMHPISAEQIKKTELTGGDAQIATRRWAFVDFDPVRAKGFERFSATDAEKAAALGKCNEVRAWLQERGFDAHILADSGNGYHLLYPIEMANDEAATTLLKNWLAALARKFKSTFVEVDTVVYNSARLTKLYGTVARKGPHSAARRHRVSRLLEYPELTEGGWYTPVPAERFQSVIDEIGVAAPTKNGTGRMGHSAGTWGVGDAAASRDLNVEEFLAQHGIEHLPAQARPGGGQMWPLVSCPFNPAHGARDAAVFKREDGVLGFKCFHESCSDKNWRHFRQHVDPSYDQLAAARREAAICGGDLYAALAACYEFRRNLISGGIEFRSIDSDEWARAEDSDFNTMKIQARREWGLKDVSVTEIMEWANSDNSIAYHPVRDWLNGLEWDGRDHIAELAGLVQTDDDETFREYLRAWYIRAVDQSLTATPNEYMVVLAGGQGVGKTTFAKSLLPVYVRRTYYYAGKMPEGKDGKSIFTSKLLIVDDELTGMRRADVETMKQILTKDEETYRPPYAKGDVIRPRLANFVGCTNESDFLTDPTGSRRFLTITMLGADLPALRGYDSTGCWAQAMALWATGERGYLSEETKTKQETMNETKTETTQWDNYVARYVRASDDRGYWANTSEIAHKIQAAIDAEYQHAARITVNQAAVRELARSLRKSAYRQDTHGAKRWCARVLSAYEIGLGEMEKPTKAAGEGEPPAEGAKALPSPKDAPAQCTEEEIAASNDALAAGLRLDWEDELVA